MRAIQRTVFEFVVIGVIGVALGFGANAIRAKGAINPAKNYFDMSVPKAPTTVHSEAATAKDKAPETSAPSDTPLVVGSRPVAKEVNTASTEDIGPGTNGQASAPSPTAALNESAAAQPAAHETAAAQESAAAQKQAASKPKHDFQMIEFQDVAAAFNDPDTAKGLNVFVDARNDDHFAEGRIPGAVQCDPYEQDRYLVDVLAHSSGAEKVIVYCNGGDCEDSIFMCRDLIMAGVPFDSVYLYEGGWKEWQAKGMPVEKGD